MTDRLSQLFAEVLQGRVSRRQVLARAAALGLSAPAVAALLAACGGSSSTPPAANATTTTSSGGSTGGSASPSPASPAAGSATTTAAGKTVDKVVVLQGSEIRFLDPTIRPTATDANVMLNIYDTLVGLDKNLQPVPGLATSWKSLNPTTWQFQLRQGVKFHDGEDFNADTIVAWWDALKNVPQGQASSIQQIATVDHVEKVSDYVVNFVTTAPDPILPKRLFIYYALITPPGPFKNKGRNALMQTGIGTGPYKFKEWVKDDHILLEANDQYWGGAPKVKQLEFRPTPEASSRASSVLTGEAQIATALPIGSLSQFQANQRAEVRSTQAATQIYWVQLNAANSEYFKKPQVRQAVNYAVDKDSIIKNVLQGHAKQNANIVTAQSWGFVQNQPYAFDVVKAKQLMADAGYPNGFTVTMDYQSADGLSADEVVQAIVSQLQAIGITVKLQQQDLSNLIASYTNKKIHDMAYIGKTLLAIDADYMFAELQPEKLFGWLFPFSGETETLYKQEHQEMDDAKRKDLAAKIQQQYRDDAGMLYLWQEDFIYGVAKTLNWTPRGDGFVLGAEMSGA